MEVVVMMLIVAILLDSKISEKLNNEGTEA